MEGEAAVLSLVGRASELYVTRGKKILHFDLAGASPPRDELLGLVMGRSGKLRSPALRTGGTLIVGYTPGLLESTLL